MSDNERMKKVLQYLSFLSVAILIMTIFQNCSPGSGVRFSDETGESTLLSEFIGGMLPAKPATGDYVRAIGKPSCSASPVYVVGAITVDAKFLNLAKDNCATVNHQIPVNTPILDFASYNPDYFGLLDAIYEKVSARANDDLPVADVWCRSEADLGGIDVVIKSNDSFTINKAKMYLGSRDNVAAAWNSKKVLPFEVKRDSSEIVSYTAEAFSLSLQPPTAAQLTSVGRLIATIDGTAYDVNLVCRVARTTAVLPTIKKYYFGIPLDSSTIATDTGFAWSIFVTTGIKPDNSTSMTNSTLKLFENGVEIGPSHSLHENIRTMGRGRFSHWSLPDGTIESIRFSSSDNSDPRKNRRVYTYTLQ